MHYWGDKSWKTHLYLDGPTAFDKPPDPTSSCAGTALSVPGCGKTLSMFEAWNVMCAGIKYHTIKYSPNMNHQVLICFDYVLIKHETSNIKHELSIQPKILHNTNWPDLAQKKRHIGPLQNALCPRFPSYDRWPSLLSTICSTFRDQEPSSCSHLTIPGKTKTPQLLTRQTPKCLWKNCDMNSCKLDISDECILWGPGFFSTLCGQFVHAQHSGYLLTASKSKNAGAPTFGPRAAMSHWRHAGGCQVFFHPYSPSA